MVVQCFLVVMFSSEEVSKLYSDLNLCSLKKVTKPHFLLTKQNTNRS